MVDLLQYPFQLNPDGTPARVPDGEDAYAQELANLIQTSPGERPLVPDYGITDPVFDELNTVELLGKIEMFGPPVTINADDVVSSFPQDGVLQINIDFTPTVSEDESDAAFEDTTADDYYDDTTTAADDIYGFQTATEG